MRILFTGAAPWANSGYSKPMRYLLPRLSRAGHACALAAFYGYQGAKTITPIDGEDVTIYPPARDYWFNDIIEYHAADFKADLVITFQDVWILDNWGKKAIRWIPWVPIDTTPISHRVLKAIEGCVFPLVMCQFGHAQLLEHGFPTARYIPIGVDTQLHRPGNKAEARAALGLPVGGFIAGMVAANASSPSRKSFPEVLQAWRKWLDGGGAGTLYIHTTLTPKRDNGHDFPRMLQTLGLEWSTLDDQDAERKGAAQVLFPNQHAMWCGAFDDAKLVSVYQSLDVLLSPSMSEGFGIPIVEAQACGVPVVTLNTTSMPELTWAGMCLEPVQSAWEDQGGWRGVAPVDGIRDAIEWAHDMSRGPKAREYMRDRARMHAEACDWDTVVAQYWLPMLEGLA